MENSSPRPQQTSCRASSEGPVPPPRSAREDGDASKTRKRPRLDSGDRAYRSLSAEASLVLPDSHSVHSLKRPLSKEALTSMVSEGQPQSITSPHSKVTLNIKEQPSISQQSEAKMETESSQQQAEIPDSQEIPPRTQSLSPQPRTPSDLGSPEIEVAEPEDALGYAGPTIWKRPGEKTIDARRQTLIDTFPLLLEMEDWRNVFSRVAVSLQWDEQDIAYFFDQLSDFMEQWVLLADECPHKIWELWSPDSELWNQFGVLNDGLIKRTTQATVVHSSMPGTLSNEIDLTEDETEASGQTIINERHAKDPVLRFFRGAVAVFCRLLQMDRQTLIETANDSAEPDLGGKPFVWMFNQYTIGGANNTSRDYLSGMYACQRWDSEILWNVMMVEFHQSKAVEDLVDCATFLIERSPSDLEYASALVMTAANVLAWSAQTEPQLPEMAQLNYRIFSPFYFKCAHKFEESIKKQAAGYTIDVITRFMGGLAESLRCLCTLDYRHTIQLLPPEFETEVRRYLPEDAIGTEYAVELTALKMRLETAFLCTKNGRMESRVAGVEAFGELLLNVYKRYFQPRREGDEIHPAVVFCKDFIQSRNLISYLVGVDSHPQIVSRSKNILGFQVITQSYLQRDTDTIWSTMRSSQDPRRSEAILDVLIAQTDYAGALFLQSFAEKLIDLPIEAYDSKMRYFLKLLLHSAPRAGHIHAPQLVEMICTKILIPILQNGLQHNSLSLKEKRERWLFAYGEFRSAASTHELSERAKSEISEIAVQSIETGGYASTAGVAILVILIDARYYGFDYGGRPYCMTEKFADLIVHDLGQCSQVLQATTLSEDDVSEILRPRLDLIERLLQTFTSWPYENSTEKLWQNLVGSGAINDKARDQAYRMLARLMHVTILRRIKFLDDSIQVYFEKLDSHNMTSSVLDFGREASTYYEKFLRKNVGDDTSLAPLPGDLFWHIALLARDQDIVEKATKAFVERNLPSSSLLPSKAMEQSHIRLVDRCVAKLTSAANTLKEHSEDNQDSEDQLMSDPTSHQESEASRTLFSRSLYILKQFLVKIREQRLGSPIIRNDSPLSDHSIHGEELKFSFYKPPPLPQVKRFITIGAESSLKELTDRLCRAVGYSQIKIFSSGRAIDLEQNAEKQLQDIPGVNVSGYLLVAKVPGSGLLKEEQYSNKLLPLEQQVLVHFDKLYNLLNLNDEMGKEVCTFLMTFPPKQDILSKSPSELLSLDSPYKSIYSCYAMKKKLSTGLSEGASCEDDLRMLVQSVGNFLVQFIDTTENYFERPADLLLFHITDCLNTALKEVVSEDVAATYFKNGSVFIHSVLKLLETALGDNDGQDIALVVRCCFSIALEACFKSSEAWTALKSYGNITAILRTSLLTSTNTSLRSNAAQALKGICAALPLMKSIDPVDFLDFFWSQILGLVPATRDVPTQSTQFFDVAMTIFRAAGEQNSSAMPLNGYLQTWSNILLSHRPQGSLPNSDPDTVVDGLAEMLTWTLQLIKSRQQTIEGAADLLRGIYTVQAFPRNKPSGYQHELELHVPVLSTMTRSKVYNLLLSLTTDQTAFAALMTLLEYVVPNSSEKNGAWSSGVAQPLEEVSDPVWLIEREKIVRAQTGYAGLKNLSNTCYLNSLFEQLFMNTRFRDFMLHAKVIDPDRTQSLLYETQRLFAYLQETWLKCVDPSNVVENIITFDSEPIDVHVQMDVDEFYNLLFDRWESQLTSPEQKLAFRKFYGGELVQQIKSRDCDHVSERFEPFSVIQCEIHNKTGLVDSLNAFIEGELMQGDNKYKCSSCDAYVNAEKRACLKDVPDNLIFHLKRFDYDLVHGSRNKINDQFEFPMEIDLAPYNVEYLQDPSSTPNPDMFMLVGILVHSGTAEVGHYYSFIRERPGIKNTWVEMNDAEVSVFDPALIPHNCFGGWDPSTSSTYQKVYNAYMLFYQRISSMEEEVSMYPTGTRSPVKAQLPVDIASQLVSENELCIKKYCLLDSSYIRFLRDILDKYRDLYQGQCSDGHAIEAKLIEGTVRQLELVFARSKDPKHLDEFLRSFEKMVRRCTRCMTFFLKAVTADGTFRNLLFRCPQDVVKQRLADEVLFGLNMLKQHDPALYEGRSDSPESPSSDDNIFGQVGVFQEVLAACDHIVETIPLLARGWDDFWSFLCRLGSRGRWELSQLQEHEYFTRALQVISYGGGLDQLSQWTFANNYLKNRARKRYNMTNVANLVVMVFQGHVDSSFDSDHDRSDRVLLNDFELKILMHYIPNDQKNRAAASVILGGFLSIYELDPELYQKIMKCYMQFNAQPSMLRIYQTTLLKGASVSPANLATPYLYAASTFVELCPDERIILTLINRLADAVQSIGDDGGEEHLRFFAHLGVADNLHFPGYEPPFLRQIVMKKLHLFVPHLLCYDEVIVRTGTASMVHNLVLDVDLGKLQDKQGIDDVRSSAKQIVKYCLQKIELLVNARKAYDIRRLDDILDVIRDCITKFSDHEADSTEYKLLKEQFDRCTDAIPLIAAQSPDGVESVEYSDSDELTDISVMPN